MKDFDFVPNTTPPIKDEHTIYGTGELAVYKNMVGQICMRQSDGNCPEFITVGPSDVPELVRHLNAVARDILSPVQPCIPPALDHSSVRLWVKSHEPIFAATIEGCGVNCSPDGGLEIELPLKPFHSVEQQQRMIVKFSDKLFREVSSDGLRLLDHKPSPTLN